MIASRSRIKSACMLGRPAANPTHETRFGLHSSLVEFRSLRFGDIYFSPFRFMNSSICVSLFKIKGHPVVSGTDCDSVPSV
jgi:hypothetical protein